MERQIRRLALGFLILFAALAVNLNYLQVIAADDLANNNANKRLLIEECAIQRGAILDADRRVLAESVDTGGEFRYERRYPEDPALGYGHITGYYSCIFGRTELEQTQNEYLSGRADELFPQRLIDEILGRDPQGASVVTSIDQDLQRLAIEGLGGAGEEGAVAALNPQTGEVLALAALPTFDPNPLASNDPDEVTRAYRALSPNEPDSPLVSRATDTFFPPGSAFKVVTAAAALENGLGPDFTLPNPSSLDLPQTEDNLDNFGGATCSGGSEIPMDLALQQSCNVYFAQLAMEVGADALVEQAERFGFNSDVPSDIPFVEGQIPQPSAFEDDIPALAQSGIGQRDVATNVLQMALVAGAIGNDGVMMQPRLVEEVRDAKGRVVRRFGPRVYGEAMSPDNAQILNGMMQAVVSGGTATGAAIPGVAVAGKTGTAQAAEDEPPHAWFIAFAPAEDPEIAVAVVVLNGGNLSSDATGGELSAPIAKTIIEEALGV
jgi:peptidoglycan glycosyltransferase